MKENWKNRIYNYEVTPPAHAWDQIASGLDDAHLADQFPAILHEMEVAPPATAWKKIAAGLAPTPTPIYRRIPIAVRYAAAAAVLVMLAWGSLQLFRGSSTNAGTDPVVTKTNPPASRNNVQPLQQADQEQQDIKALEASKETLATLDLTPRKQKTIAAYDEFVHPVSADMEFYSFAPQNTYRDLDHADRLEPSSAVNTSNNLSNRYIMLITPDGNIIRMSKKLSDLVCCVSGEEQDDDCKDQLNKWRSKMVSTPNHSAGNFMEILNMVNSLQGSK